jgi:hypothetical protein
MPHPSREIQGESLLVVLLLDGRRFIGVVQEFLEDAGLFALFARRRA